jgi:hypothetical protein
MDISKKKEGQKTKKRMDEVRDVMEEWKMKRKTGEMEMYGWKSFQFTEGNTDK